MNSNWVDLPDFSDKEEHGPFEPLSFAKRSWQDNKSIRYRVYRSASDFVEVEAPTASVAIKLSKIEEPCKVERMIKENQPLVNDDDLTSAVDVYNRPVLEVLTDESPVVSNQVLTGLVEASEEIKEEEIKNESDDKQP